jgi:hypothetical protein
VEAVSLEANNNKFNLKTEAGALALKMAKDKL